MRCPVCGSRESKVIDSRDGRDGGIRRRRGCSDCGHRFTTRERIEEALPVVVKRSGARQSFDRAKILRALELACRKRPLPRERLEGVALVIEQWAATRGDRDVSSEEIGQHLMHHLYALDQVAYVRFVSVYRSFETTEEFERLLHEMAKAERVDVEGQRSLFEQPAPGHDPAAGPPGSWVGSGKR